MPSFTVRTATLALTGALLLGLAAPAGAGDVATFDTAVKIRNKAPAFHGRVVSDNDVCTVNRRVKLYRQKRPGNQAKLLGKTDTDSHGKWAILEPEEFTLKSGLYFAKAPRVTVSDNGLPTVCTRAKSKKVVVD